MRCTQIVNEAFDVFGCESQGLGPTACISLKVAEMLVLDVATQRIAHDLALCLSGCAGKCFCLGG